MSFWALINDQIKLTQQQERELFTSPLGDEQLVVRVHELQAYCHYLRQQKRHYLAYRLLLRWHYWRLYWLERSEPAAFDSVAFPSSFYAQKRCFLSQLRTYFSTSSNQQRSAIAGEIFNTYAAIRQTQKELIHEIYRSCRTFCLAAESEGD